MVLYLNSERKLLDTEAALQVAKNLEKSGYKVMNIKDIEADIKWLREKGYVK